MEARKGTELLLARARERDARHGVLRTRPRFRHTDQNIRMYPWQLAGEGAAAAQRGGDGRRHGRVQGLRGPWLLSPRFLIKGRLHQIYE